MIIKQEQTSIKGSVVETAEEIKVKIDPKLFMITSERLYSDKIAAFLRELISNADDIHEKTGQTRPYFIHVPTELEPWFVIRDFGTGLEPDRLVNVVFTFFGSDKDNDPNAIGGFGLGAKSPWAYAKGFTVINYYQGKKYTYSMVMDAGYPKPIPMGEEDTDEPNGLEFRVDIQQKDIKQTVKRLCQILRGFGHRKPELSIDLSDRIRYFPQNLDVFTHSDCMEGSEKSESLGAINPNYKVFAFMANVAYPIPQELADNYVLNVISPHVTTYIKFNNGELNLHPSREQLSLDDDTVEALNARMAEIQKMQSELVHRNVTNLRRESSTLADVFEKIRGYSDEARKIILASKDPIMFVDGVNILHLWQDRYTAFTKAAEANEIEYRTKRGYIVYPAGTSQKMVSLDAIWGFGFNTRITRRDIRINGSGETSSRSNRKSSVIGFDSMFTKVHDGFFVLVNNTKYTGVTMMNHLINTEVHTKPNKPIVVLSGSESGVESVITALKHFAMGREIVVYNAHDHVDDLKKARVKEKAKRDAGNVRPKTPNVLEMTATEPGNVLSYKKENLFLSANEVRAIDGLYVNMYYDDMISATSGVTVGFDTGALRVAGVDKYYRVRTMASKYIKEAPKAKCLVQYLIEHVRGLDINYMNVTRSIWSSQDGNENHSVNSWYMDKVEHVFPGVTTLLPREERMDATRYIDLLSSLYNIARREKNDALMEEMQSIKSRFETALRRQHRYMKTVRELCKKHYALLDYVAVHGTITDAMKKELHTLYKDKQNG